MIPKERAIARSRVSLYDTMHIGGYLFNYVTYSLFIAVEPVARSLAAFASNPATDERFSIETFVRPCKKILDVRVKK